MKRSLYIFLALAIATAGLTKWLEFPQLSDVSFSEADIVYITPRDSLMENTVNVSGWRYDGTQDSIWTTYSRMFFVGATLYRLGIVNVGLQATTPSDTDTLILQLELQHGITGKSGEIAVTKWFGDTDTLLTYTDTLAGASTKLLDSLLIWEPLMDSVSHKTYPNSTNPLVNCFRIKCSVPDSAAYHNNYTIGGTSAKYASSPPNSAYIEIISVKMDTSR